MTFYSGKSENYTSAINEKETGGIRKEDGKQRRKSCNYIKILKVNNEKYNKSRICLGCVLKALNQ